MKDGRIVAVGRTADVVARERGPKTQMIDMYTTGAAYLQHSEKDRGSIETGKLADLVVIDRDYLTCAEDEIRKIEPIMAIVAGRIAYSR